MGKGEETREKVVRRAAQLFNQQGYAGASLTDIMQVTGLRKGGIYNHFDSKEQLALEAFDYAASLVRERFTAALREKYAADERLIAIVNAFRSLIDDPPLAGGCPVLNTAIESDDAHPQLRERARQAMDDWRALIQRIIAKGLIKGELRPGVDADTVATLMIATLEGAVMLSKLYGDPIHMRRAADHLIGYIEGTLRV